MKGFSVLGAIMAVAVAGVLALTIPVMVGQNQDLRTTHLQSMQAFYSDRAGLEFAQRQIRQGGNPETIPARSFAGAAWSFMRASSQVQSSTTIGSAATTLLMTDPNPPGSGDEADYLSVDISSASISAGKDLKNVTLQKNAETPSSITISSMQISWTGSSGSGVTQIRIGNTNYYSGNASAGPSGTTFTLSPSYTLSDTSVYNISRIRWDSISTPTTITIKFNLSDASSKTVNIVL